MLRHAVHRWRLATAAGASAAAAGAGGVALCESPVAPGFDPEALERGAKALREINKSANAKQVIELARQQELTKQAETKKAEAEFAAAAARANVEQERVRWEEQRKTVQADASAKAQLAQYNDELARKRADREHEAARARNAELVGLQEEGVRRQEAERVRAAAAVEAERRATAQYQAGLDKEIARERALAEAEGRAAEARANEDVNRRALLLKLEEDRRRVLDSINAIFSNVGSAGAALLADRARLSAAVAGFSALALGVYGAREGARVAARAADRWLGTPALVRETSLARWWRPGSGAKAGAPAKGADAVKRDFSDIILPRPLGDTVRGLAAATSATRAHGAPFRHMLFYGPPGTGKSMAAKRLARTAGLDYAILTGGDVAPLGAAAAPALHSLFDWAERSPRGLLLFVDEADAFLGRRGPAMGEATRGALNAALARTGDQSPDFCLVLATNRPEDLDPAVLDRMDEALLFPLPGEGERASILKIYVDAYLRRTGPALAAAAAAGAPRRPLSVRLAASLRGRGGAADAITLDGVDDAAVAAAAAATDGFSGRELAKLVAAAQAAAYASPTATLTRGRWDEVVAEKVAEHAARRAMVEGKGW